MDRLFPKVRLSTLSASFVRNTRDDAFEPTRGSLVTFDGTLATRAMGSEVGFVKALFQGFTFKQVPLLRGAVIGGGARLGLGFGFPQLVLDPDGTGLYTNLEQEIPASERFFAGGDSSVRGFALDRLGSAKTLDYYGVSKGGNGLLIFNTELRVPLFSVKGYAVGGATFVDVGNVFARVSDMSLGDLRSGAGFGLRMQLPVGPLRMDFAWKLNPLRFADGTREDRFAWYITLGAGVLMHGACEETTVETVGRRGSACAFGVAVLLVVGLLASPPASAAIVLDRVVAVVGAQVITLSDVRVAETFGLGAVGLGPEGNADLVTTLVNRQLALSEVERYAAPDADSAQVDRRIADIRRKFANSQAFASALARTGLSEARLRDLVANDLRIVAYLEQMFGAASQPGPDDLQRYYRDHQAEFQQGRSDGHVRRRSGSRVATVCGRTTSSVDRRLAGPTAPTQHRGDPGLDHRGTVMVYAGERPVGCASGVSST